MAKADGGQPACGRMRILAAGSLTLLFLFAGCTATPAAPPLSAETYHMDMNGVPVSPVAPGSTFDVSVMSSMGSGMRMHRMDSDHMGAHFWNRTAADPTADLGNSTACVHRTGEMPSSFTATCTAPMLAGTYHIRAHARIMENGTMYNWWGTEQMFTVA